MRPIRELVGEAVVYLQGMERRAQRRKSPWNLLLALFALILVPSIWYILLQTVLGVGHLFAGYSFDLDDRSDLASRLILVPLLFVSMPIAFMATNWLIKLIPKAVEVFNIEAEGDELAKLEGRVGPNYQKAQAGLKLCAAIVSPLALISLFAALFVN